MRKLLFLALIAVLVFAQVSPGAFAAYDDIATNWARKSILALEERGILEGIFSEEYGPHQPLDRATFRVLVQRAFELDEDALSRVFNNEDADDALVTRSELVTTAAELLGITEANFSLAKWYPTFEDLSEDNDAYLAAEVFNMMGILPTYIFNRFEPDRPATRAEIAHLLSQTSTLQPLLGEISELAEEMDQVMIQVDEELRALTLTSDTRVYQGGAVGGVEQLQAGERIFAVYNDDGEILVISKPQRGLAALVDTEVLMNRLGAAAEAAAEVLTPEQVTALLNGDWQTLSDEVRYELHHRLVDLGVSPWEVDALLAQDWATVQEIIKDRLAAEAADYLDVSPDLVFAAVNRNWQSLLEYLQVELAQRLLTSSWLKEASPGVN